MARLVSRVVEWQHEHEQAHYSRLQRCCTQDRYCQPLFLTGVRNYPSPYTDYDSADDGTPVSSDAGEEHQLTFMKNN